MASVQRALFDQLPRLPEGFHYDKQLCSPDEENRLIASFERLPFREFEFRGFLGKKRTVSFGWRYDFNVRELQQTEHIPAFLLPLRNKAAEFANLSEGVVTPAQRQALRLGIEGRPMLRPTHALTQRLRWL